MDLQASRLDIESIRAGLRGSIGRHLLYFPETGSTNAELLASRPGAPVHGAVVITDYQTAGRGRLQRVWLAPPCSSLLFSVALAWPEDLPVAQSVMLAALAVADALESQVRLKTQLKWPNDVLVDGKKICGILGESSPRGYVVLGIGLNVNFDPSGTPGLPDTATSVECAAGGRVAREPLFLAVAGALEMWYRGVTRNRDGVFRAWCSRLALIGKDVSVHDSTGWWDGTAICLNPDGGLRVRARGGQERLVYAADVSLRAKPGTLQAGKRPLQ